MVVRVAKRCGGDIQELIAYKVLSWMNEFNKISFVSDLKSSQYRAFCFSKWEMYKLRQQRGLDEKAGEQENNRGKVKAAVNTRLLSKSSLPPPPTTISHIALLSWKLLFSQQH